MGEISKIKTVNKGTVEVTLQLNNEKLLWLEGYLDKMHVFSEKNLSFTTRLIKRGKRESTKYFLLPKELRNSVFPSNVVSCNRIETETNNIIIFSVPKKEMTIEI